MEYYETLAQQSPKSKPKVYIAAASACFRELLDLPTIFPQIHWTASWPQSIGKIPETPAFASKFWEKDFSEISNSHYLLLWAMHPHQLRGALVEAGYALAIGIPVLLVGDHLDFGSWQFHPEVYKFRNITEAMLWIENFNKY